MKPRQKTIKEQARPKRATRMRPAPQTAEQRLRDWRRRARFNFLQPTGGKE